LCPVSIHPRQGREQKNGVGGAYGVRVAVAIGLETVTGLRELLETNEQLAATKRRVRDEPAAGIALYVAGEGVGRFAELTGVAPELGRLEEGGLGAGGARVGLGDSRIGAQGQLLFARAQITLGAEHAGTGAL